MVLSWLRKLLRLAPPEPLLDRAARAGAFIKRWDALTEARWEEANGFRQYTSIDPDGFITCEVINADNTVRALFMFDTDGDRWCWLAKDPIRTSSSGVLSSFSELDLQLVLDYLTKKKEPPCA
jgi:hypothetical protein